METSGIIALSFIILIGIVMIAALFVFKNVDAVLKLWGGLGTIATAIVTFYFTNDKADKAQREKAVAIAQSAKAEGELEATKTALAGARFDRWALAQKAGDPEMAAILKKWEDRVRQPVEKAGAPGDNGSAQPASKDR